MLQLVAEFDRNLRGNMSESGDEEMHANRSNLVRRRLSLWFLKYDAG